MSMFAIFGLFQRSRDDMDEQGDPSQIIRLVQELMLMEKVDEIQLLGAFIRLNAGDLAAFLPEIQKVATETD